MSDNKAKLCHFYQLTLSSDIYKYTDTENMFFLPVIHMMLPQDSNNEDWLNTHFQFLTSTMLLHTLKNRSTTLLCVKKQNKNKDPPPPTHTHTFYCPHLADLTKAVPWKSCKSYPGLIGLYIWRWDCIRSKPFTFWAKWNGHKITELGDETSH